MKRKYFSIVFILTAIFALQSFDIPPVPNFFNPKTCCGKTVCLCSHAKGALCPIRQHREAVSKAPLSPVHGGSSVAVPHKACHLPLSPKADVQKEETEKKEGQIVFGKAPCHKDAPPSVLPGFSKDFITAVPVVSSFSSNQTTVPTAVFDARLLLWQQGIDRPPKAFSLTR